MISGPLARFQHILRRYTTITLSQYQAADLSDVAAPVPSHCRVLNHESVDGTVTSGEVAVDRQWSALADGGIHCRAAVCYGITADAVYLL
jgi:hypothetical protein